MVEFERDTWWNKVRPTVEDTPSSWHFERSARRLQQALSSFSFVVFRAALGLGGVAAMVGGIYAHYKGPVGFITPPLRSLALVGFGAVVATLALSLRKMS